MKKTRPTVDILDPFVAPMGPTLRQPVTRQAFYEYRPFFEVFRFSRPIGESWLPKFDIEDNEITQHNFFEGHRKMFNGHSAIFGLLLFTSVGCSTEQDPPNQRVEKAPTEVGPYFVANTTITVNDSIRSRALTLEIWYQYHPSRDNRKPSKLCTK